MLSDIQKVNQNIRPDAPGLHEVKVNLELFKPGLTGFQLTSEGLVLDVEFASPVSAGLSYSLEGVTFDV